MLMQHYVVYRIPNEPTPQVIAARERSTAEYLAAKLNGAITTVDLLEVTKGNPNA